MAGIQVVGNRWTVADAPDDAPAGLVCIGLKGEVDRAAVRRAVARPEAAVAADPVPAPRKAAEAATPTGEDLSP